MISWETIGEIHSDGCLGCRNPSKVSKSHRLVHKHRTPGLHSHLTASSTHAQLLLEACQGVPGTEAACQRAGLIMTCQEG